MYGNSVEESDPPGNPYFYMAAKRKKELDAAKEKISELERKVQHSFKSEEELVSSSFFQCALSKSLAFKDRQIRELQEEILKISAQRAQAQQKGPAS